MQKKGIEILRLKKKYGQKCNNTGGQRDKERSAMLPLGHLVDTTESVKSKYSIYVLEKKGALSPIIDNDLYLSILSISHGVICQTVAVFGVLANIINIVIFSKQGFIDRINISLLALAVSDLMSLLFIMWSNICFTQDFRKLDIPLVSTEVQLISGSWPHVIFTRTTGWITAFITLERCLCVTIPLKVKTIFTKKRHVISMVSIFVVTIWCSMLAYVSLGLDWKFYPDRNKTLLGLIYRMSIHERKITDSVGYAISGVFMPITCFCSVVTLTIILVAKLNQQRAWRKAMMSADGDTMLSKTLNSHVSGRDQKAAMMIILISVIFIICFLPAVGIFIVGYAEPELSYDGVYKNMFLVTLSISFTTEAINSSINIFVYISMSTKYREVFLNCVQRLKP